MARCCASCKSYEPINHRGQRYPKGKCEKHFAYRLNDRYQTHLTISLPYEYVCDLHDEKPMPVYAVVDGEPLLVPPIVAKDLIAMGWVYVKMDQREDGGVSIQKGDEQ